MLTIIPLLPLFAVHPRRLKNPVWVGTNGCFGYGLPIPKYSPWGTRKAETISSTTSSGFCMCSSDEISTPHGCAHIPVVCNQECANDQTNMRGSPRTTCSRTNKNVYSKAGIWSFFSFRTYKRKSKEGILLSNILNFFGPKLKIRPPRPGRKKGPVDYVKLKKHFDSADIMKIRSKLMRFKDIPSRLCYSATDFKHQKGITIVGGASPRYRTAFWVAIHCIRRVDPQIPIELWLPDGDESVLSIENLEYLQNNFVWLRNFKEIYSGIKGVELPKNFELKIYALLFSDFKEVLLLDSDNLPISSVEHLFNDTDYIKHGSLHWMDFWISTSDPDSNITLGNSSIVDHSYESGQILVNKEKTWPALLLSLYMTNNAHIFYPLTVGYLGFGDKEILPAALRFLNIEYSIVKHGPDHVGVFEQGNQWGTRRIYGNTMLQHDPDGHPLFLHSNLGKWSPHVPMKLSDYVFRWSASILHGSRIRQVINARAEVDLELWIYSLINEKACFFDDASKPRFWYEKLGIGPFLEGMFICEVPYRNTNLEVFRQFHDDENV